MLNICPLISSNYPDPDFKPITPNAFDLLTLGGRFALKLD